MAADGPQALAAQLCAVLASACERLEIAGSIRRGKPDPKDIELVAIPHVITVPQNDMFGTPVSEHSSSLLDMSLEQLVELEGWEYDQVVKRNGPRYKRLRHVASGVCCDLFITTPERWGVIFTIRTGPADFSQELVTRALRRGLKVDDGRLWRLHRDNTRSEIQTPTEQDFFAALGLPYLEPAQRRLEAAVFPPRRPN